MDSAKGVATLRYKVVPVHKNSGEKEPDAIWRLVKDMAAQGWELVEACGDEIRMPSLIFRQYDQAKTEQYLVEIVPHIKGLGEVDDIRNELLTKHDQGWLVLTVLDSPLSPPVAAFKKKVEPVPNVKVIIVPIGILSNTAETIKREITQQEVISNCRLRSVMHSGLSPVLIFLTNTGEPECEYDVEHAKGGLFSNQSKKLEDLIVARAAKGWKVCGAFEDEALMPCVVFSREAQP